MMKSENSDEYLKIEGDDSQPLFQALIRDGQAVQPKGDLRVQEPHFSAPAHDPW